jgi:peptide methionine sulfoxide reductase msrA/msrB
MDSAWCKHPLGASPRLVQAGNDFSLLSVFTLNFITMLTWKEILQFARHGNPTPDQTIVKSDADWKAQLTPDQYRITRQHGTERPFSGEYCGVFELALYACVCCGTLLFDAREKFESGTGWPSFTQPIKANAIKYIEDLSHGMQRVETRCNSCDAHLGHVFPDGPQPSGLRYCMNSVALQKAEALQAGKTETATFGGGCFWCTEALFESLKGVHSVVSGYSGGQVQNPTYKQVCSGITGHAEVVQITYDPAIISYKDLVTLHILSHDPTTLNRQGADEGTQYRSVIFFHNDAQKITARKVLEELKSEFKQPIVTEVSAFTEFYKAEAYHQDYFKNNPGQPYCQVVIHPKVKKFKEKFGGKLK